MTGVRLREQSTDPQKMYAFADGIRFRGHCVFTLPEYAHATVYVYAGDVCLRNDCTFPRWVYDYSLHVRFLDGCVLSRWVYVYGSLNQNMRTTLGSGAPTLYSWNFDHPLSYL